MFILSAEKGGSDIPFPLVPPLSEAPLSLYPD